MADKLAATFHPDLYECADCGARYVTPSAADDCCGDWLDTLD